MKTILSFVLFVLCVSVASAQIQVYTSPQIKLASATVTRDSNAATYAANDAIVDKLHKVLALPLGRRDGVGGVIRSVAVVVDTPNVTNGTFDVIFYNDSASVTAGTDTAAFAFTSVHASKFINKVAVTLKTYGTGSTYSYDVTNNLNIHFTPISTSKNIYVGLVATAAWVPKSAATIKVIVEYQQE